MQVWKSNFLTFFQMERISSGCRGIRFGMLQKKLKLITPGLPGTGLEPEGEVKIVSALTVRVD